MAVGIVIPGRDRVILDRVDIGRIGLMDQTVGGNGFLDRARWRRNIDAGENREKHDDKRHDHGDNDDENLHEILG